MRDWGQAARLFLDRRLLALVILGFSSGLPFLLVYSTLSFWLRLEGVSLTQIGWFSLAGLAYGFKFAWAPLVDHLPVPGLTRMLGQRRGWLIAAQLVTAGCLVGLGSSQPGVDLGITAAWAVALAFASATQDIVADAYRIEMLGEDDQGGGAANFVNGYRVGTLAAGAGALVVAETMGWFWAYAAMAGLMVPGMIIALALPEPERAISHDMAGKTWGERFNEAILEPFREFSTREHWLVILIFIALYKYGDALLGAMANPFYADLGFNGFEIAAVTKGWGLAMSFVGAFLGGLLSLRYGILQALLITGIMQVAGNLAFAALALVGKSLAFLTFAIAAENLTGAMATTAFVAYLSGLCNVRFSATQYALLSSVTALTRTFFAAGGGWLADQIGWSGFFIVTIGAAVPGLVILLWLMRASQSPNDSLKPDHPGG